MFLDYNLLQQIEKRKKSLKTYNRSCVIIKKFIGLTIGVHNGKSFVPVTIKDNMIGHKLGEFAYTRAFGKIHLRKNKNKKK
jgi:small subunit ribosomal protein S19